MFWLWSEDEHVVLILRCFVTLIASWILSHFTRYYYQSEYIVGTLFEELLLIRLKLYTCFGYGLKTCMWFWYNPRIFRHLIQDVKVAIFRHQQVFLRCNHSLSKLCKCLLSWTRIGLCHDLNIRNVHRSNEKNTLKLICIDALDHASRTIPGKS